MRDPWREIEVYRSILAREQLGTPACYGASIDRDAGRFWLFLERVDGLALWRVGDIDVWKAAARWLARLHATCAGAVSSQDSETRSHLAVYDGDYFRRWIARALDFARARGGREVHALERLSARYEGVVARLLEMPRTLIHGEFYASNVLAQETAQGVRIAPIDWEMAGWGPAAIDLAALVSGDWSPEQVLSFAEEYRAAWLSQGQPLDDAGRLHEWLCCCRVHLAVQWLGWARKWKPPREHARDWLAEAIGNAEQLQL